MSGVLDQSGEDWPRPFVLCTAAAVEHAHGAPPAVVAEQLRQARDLAVAQGSMAAARRIESRAARLGLPLD